MLIDFSLLHFLLHFPRFVGADGLNLQIQKFTPHHITAVTFLTFTFKHTYIWK